MSGVFPQCRQRVFRRVCGIGRCLSALCWLFGHEGVFASVGAALESDEPSVVDGAVDDAAGLDLVRRAATRESTFQGSVSECIRQAQATAPGYDPAPDEGPTGLWPAANMFPDPAVLPGAMPMETPDRPGPAQDAGMDGPAIGA